MSKAITAVVVTVCMGFVWLIGFALLALMMSGDGTRHHLPVFALYILGGLTAIVAFAMLASRAASGGGSQVAMGVVGFSLGGAAAVAVLAVVSIGIGVVLNA